MSPEEHAFGRWPDRMSRREILRLGAAAGAGLLLTPLLGCGSDEETQGTPTGVPTAVPPSGFFDSDGVKIHYETWGEGRPIVLVHGFPANLEANWVATNWVETLKPVRRVVGLDCRGHGQSDKPHEAEAYGENMGLDVLRLMDYLGIEKADLMGYSMGGYISAYLLAKHQERFTSVVLGGIGSPFESGGPAIMQAIADALLVEDPSMITNDLGRGFRIFADLTPGNDREALAACIKNLRAPMEPSDFADVNIPTLIVAGGSDFLARKPENLKAAIPGAEMVTIPDRDHIATIVDRRFKDAVLGFLSET